MSDSQTADHDDSIESVQERFEEAWAAGTAPDIRDFLTGVSKELKTELAVELIQIDLERRWRSSSKQIKLDSSSSLSMQPQIEEYLSITELVDLSRTPLLELLQAEFRVRQQWGDRPSIDEFRNRFPAHTDAITKSFPAAPFRIETLLEPGPQDGNDDFIATMIQHRDQLEQTPAGESFKPLPSTKAYRPKTSISSIVVQSRDIRAAGSGTELAEYETGELLGEGGMGIVHKARQGSLDRSVALKISKAGASTDPDHQNGFLTEAIITGMLEHPNIVPIYDLGSNNDGVLFYAMKEVRGAPWTDTIDTATKGENLDVLLRVADALALAHSRGVIHRDLKPDNVMLGEFGEVLVMDWGLALPTGDVAKKGLTRLLRPAGTPAFMAPEMVKGPFENLGPTSDVYLLGAMLFRALTGKPPHTGRHSFECMNAAAKNVIVEVDRDDELLDIARKAMATDVEDRYQSASEFQDAIREYRSHAESHRLTELAQSQLSAATSTGDYRQFEKSVLAFEEAIELWSGNSRARESLGLALLTYARTAFERGDFELAERQLNETDDEHMELLAAIRVARVERDSRLNRLRRMKQVAASLAAVVFVTVSVAAFMINSARKKEAIARDVATKHFKGIQTAMANLTDTSDELKNYPRLQPVRHMMLKLVSSYYGRLSASAETFSQTRLEHTRSLIRLGNIHSLMARHKDAIAAYQQAVDQTPQLIADSSTKTDGERLKLMALIKLSATGIATQDFERADSRLIEVIKAIETDAIFKSTADAQALLADALFTQARLHQEKGDWRKAVDLLTQARKTYEAIVGGKRSRLAKIGLATTLSTLGQSYERTGDVRSSESAFLDAQTVWNELISIDESDPKSLEGLAVSQIDLGNLLRTYGKEPLESYTEGIQRWNSLVEVRPEIPHYQFNLANAQMSLAGWLNRLGKPEAQDFAIEAINWMIRLSIAYPKDDRYRDGEAVALILLGEILRDRGQVEDSQTYLIDAWKHFDAVISKRPLPKHRERLAESLLLLGQLAESKSDTDEALRRMTAGLEQVESLLNDNKKTPQHQDIAAWAQFRLAWLDWSGGRSDMARQRVESAIELRKAMPKTAMWLESHAWLLLFSPDPKQRNPRMASELLTEATGLCPNNSRLWRTQCLVQIRLNQIVAAEVSLKKSTGSAPVEVVEKCFLLTIIRLLQGDSKAAQKQFDHGVEVMNSSCPGNPRVKSIMREAAAAIGTRPQS